MFQWGEPMVWGTPVHLISRDPARELVLEQIHHFRKKVLLSVAWLEKIRWGTTTQESGHFCIEPFLKHSILGPSAVSLCTQIKAQLPTYPFWNFRGPHFLGDRWPTRGVEEKFGRVESLPWGTPRWLGHDLQLLGYGDQSAWHHDIISGKIEGMLRLHSRAQLLFGELHTKSLAGFDSDNTTCHSSNVMVLRSFGGAAQSIRACQPAVPRRFLSSWTSVIPLVFDLERSGKNTRNRNIRNTVHLHNRWYPLVN